MCFARQIFMATTMAVSVLSTVSLSAQDVLAPLAGEYLISGVLPGNQVYSDLVFDQDGGYVVWQDDAIDGVGSGIAAQRLNNNLSGTLSPIRINSIAAGHQEKPKLASLEGGGAVFVWQGGDVGRQDIFARVLAVDGTFPSIEFQVNQNSDHFQIAPSVAVLADGSFVVVWESQEQDGHLRAVLGRLFDSSGNPLTDEFLINQTTRLNQRSVSIAALSGGGFVVAWVSEILLGQDQFGGAQFTAAIMDREFDSSGLAVRGERRLNSDDGICATPTVVALDDGGYVVAWAKSDPTTRENGWDIYAVGIDAAGAKAGVERMVNTHRFGDQYGPRLARDGGSLFVVWNSLGQDGSFNGIYGRILSGGGVPFDREVQINTSTYNRQLHPVVSADELGRFLVVWSSYLVGGNGFELHGQRLASTHPLPTMPAPFANPLSQSRILVSWPELAGYSVEAYELHVDGGASVVTTTNRQLVVSNLVAGSSHNFRLTFLLADGRRGDLSTETQTSTWSEDGNFDGLPDDWQQLFWADQSVWPDRNEDSDGDGASNLTEFLAGTDPTDQNSVLAASIEKLGSNVWLRWASRPGSIYRVQTTTTTSNWIDYGNSRFAPDSTDTVIISGVGDSAIFRILRLR